MHTFAVPTDRSTLPHARCPRPRHIASLICALTLVQGCTARVDLKRMAYETLRREDCRLNQLDAFCHRTFANEYAEYERLRQDFIRETTEDAARTRPVKADR